MTLGNWLTRWYGLYVEPSRLALSTKAMYRRAIDAVPKKLGQVDLSELTGLDLQEWLVRVAKQTPRAAQLDRCMLVKALSVAAKAGLCREGICDPQLVPKPLHAPSKAVILTVEEVQAYLTAAQTSDCYPLLMLCLCGLRRGEALGARWQDLEGAYLTIKRQRLRVARRYAVTQPKSEKALRTLRLPDALLAQPFLRVVAVLPLLGEDLLHPLPKLLLVAAADELLKGFPAALHARRRFFLPGGGRLGLPFLLRRFRLLAVAHVG